MTRVDHILIVGLGSIGKRHLKMVREYRPNSCITILRSKVGSEIAEEKIADKIVYKIEEALDTKSQAVIIATPAPFHHTSATIFIKNDMHVLVEKPLEESLASARKLEYLQADSNVVGLVGYCLRYDPNAIKFKQMIEQHVIGDVLHVTVECGSYLPDWRPGQDYKKTASSVKALGGGVLLELSHELDYLRWFFGDVVDVSAKFSNSDSLDIDVEDQADLLLTTQADVAVNVHLDFNTRETRRFCKVQGTEGNIIWDAVNNKVILHLAGKAPRIESNICAPDQKYREQLTHFIDCIENKKAPRVSFSDGVKVLEVIEAARISNESGRRVSIS